MSPLPRIEPDIAAAMSQRQDIVRSMSRDDIPRLRAGLVAPSPEDVTFGGLLEHTWHEVPAADPAVKVSLLRPRLDDDVPVIYFVHGGGLVLGTALDSMPYLAPRAHAMGVAVASVEYRLAPEHPYPAALDDVYAGLVWVHDHASDLGLDATRIVVAGISAGGGLAAALALAARDRSGPPILGQMLICPMLDDRNDSESARHGEGLGAWDRTANETAWDAYLGPDRRGVPIYASPGRAEDLSGLPPAFLDVGSSETFRDEVVDYARRIWSRGGSAELHVWPGGVHGFDDLAPEAAMSRHARDARDRWLVRLLRHSAKEAHGQIAQP